MNGTARFDCELRTTLPATLADVEDFFRGVRGVDGEGDRGVGLRAGGSCEGEADG